ncbi:MAG: Trk family potassium uptake protein [Clostridiales bacterium]|nr:Trk family potassium uptake protein [Clostridiales bacterium]MBQ1743831.1 Trk family potassium uptake protein [Clostridiales bacterium]MBQ2155324.1 Trk family potassium uptake protein [Clostridiales bacterium]MBQ5520392.1 Trk family potassium uptake protein [Clostridiales bacterium]
MTKSGKRHFRLSGAQTILLGFVILILAGAFLLMLPFSSRSGEWTSVTDALFTATSASCVTGLVLYDTWSHWTWFGQLVILSLIQIGGMGVVTMTTVLSKIVGKRLGLQARTTMQEAVSAPNLGEIMKYTRFIFLGCMIFEVLGAVALSPVFISEYGPLKGIWLSVFTSISAFCNAGFDLNGTHGEFSSMTPYMDNPVVVITLVFLILTGGLGFLTWMDIRKHGFKFYKYSTQSKLIIVMELLLVFIPMIYLWFGEYGDYPANQRFLASLFQAVTPRTAGFNTTDYNDFSGTGVVMTIILMLIGGAPGSTAGGMKITTITILFLTMLAFFKREKSPAIFKRRITTEAIYGAVAVFMLDVMLAVLGSMSIARIEHRAFLTALFESASAVGTVGLSMGITPTLHTVSKFILIILMYTGRVGGLTLVFAAITRKSTGNRQYPADNIAVG